MKRIRLTQGQFAIIDNKDYKWLSQHKWRANWSKCTQSFYAERTGKLKDGKWHTISMAREILGLTYGDIRQADHINHITLNNRRENLRIVTRNQNQWNRKNSKGYYRDKGRKKYRATIVLNNIKTHLGCFCTIKAARNAYLKAKEKYHKMYPQ